ncbi:DEAD/DEAH box helicase [Cellvibrio zantedeschiae]|uniref:DEAD/DEAH box helicase n=1 Tax=Cellvibrio zantedeschiae TaxID=1237077 RepID=A0ABQ3AVX0_9GAMM|nr:ATP-dependent DNA helicase [Cellvibrio zantedeschiae]GGY68127.1 DEAD/DEAH box helicase [Cellvibrio zantedeschiae]
MLAGNKSKIVAVKTLVEFAAKTGSIDRKFTPSPTGLEGIEGHQRVTANRPDDYQTEISLSIQFNDLTFRGRADGYSPVTGCIEEIKTFYGDVEKIPHNHRQLHWAQAKCYGWMMCAQSKCDSIKIALIYFNLTDQKEYRFEEMWSAQDLQNDFEILAAKYCAWHAKINLRLQRLEPWIDQLQFPYETMHSSQRLMAEAVYKSAVTGRVVLAEAPTGTGKTLAGLFPAIKAMTRTEVNKVFYLTAKTTGKQLALENIHLIATDSQNIPLRTLELTAQEKSCLQPEKQCNGDDCIYAFNFYEKLEAAREAAYGYPVLHKNALAELAHEFEICPFYLSIEMSRWVDIIIADVNYYFDGTPLLLGLTQEFNWRPYLLVDESHNLIDRGRQMYSGELDRKQLLSAKKSAPASIKNPLNTINKIWLKLINEFGHQNLAIIPALPEKFSLALLEFTNKYIELLQQNPEHPIQRTLAHEFFFAALQFQKVLEAIGDDFCIDLQSLNTKAEILTVRNLIPARLLAQRTEYAQGACFFSATLHPAHYYQSLLGLPDDCVHIKVPSPFHRDQLTVKLARNLSTRFKDRLAAIEPICNLICEQLTDNPGNAIAFFPSYEFLQKVEERLQFKLANQHIKIVAQSRQMNESERQEFIEQFNQHNNVLGLAVLGGAFSEGIDLAGDALKGVFIATLGLPQMNPVTEHLRNVMQTKFQRGYDFTYTYPGIQKVIQAAGRVIRTKTDTGYLWLLDERFQQSDIRKLLPDWWNISSENVKLTNEKPRMS